MEEWKEYIKLHSEPLTVCQKSPSGGLHCFFNATSLNYTDEENDLINMLKNKSKYRNRGIDIRKNNGYVVCEPSSINGKKYEFIRHYKDNEILNFPKPLLKWLLEYENNNISVSNILIIIMNNIEELQTILKEFDNNTNWIKLTACIKNLLHEYNKFAEDELLEIWDKWSKGGIKYNKKNNYKIWHSINLKINFNYLINATNLKSNKNIELFETVKSYTPITSDISNIKYIEMNNNFIHDISYRNEQFDENTLLNYDTVIIESTTGIGKTSNTAKLVNKYLECCSNKGIVEKYKVLSIVSRISLASQHVQSFEKEDIIMSSYLDINKDVEDDNLVICLNSILLFSKYKPSFFKNYIVYLDEITTFTRHLTHNATINNLKLIYTTLMKIILNCKKLILTEAIINDNVFNIIAKRTDNKMFIRNAFKKYDGINAIQYNDENKFLSFISSEVQKNSYFLFGCDSNDIITKYYTECAKYSENCILITADTKFKLEDVNE
jgi:hypothetical protein